MLMMVSTIAMLVASSAIAQKLPAVPAGLNVITTSVVPVGYSVYPHNQSLYSDADALTQATSGTALGANWASSALIIINADLKQCGYSKVFASITEASTYFRDSSVTLTSSTYYNSLTYDKKAISFYLDKLNFTGDVIIFKYERLIIILSKRYCLNLLIVEPIILPEPEVIPTPKQNPPASAQKKDSTNDSTTVTPPVVTVNNYYGYQSYGRQNGYYYASYSYQGGVYYQQPHYQPQPNPTPQHGQGTMSGDFGTSGSGSGSGGFGTSGSGSGGFGSSSGHQSGGFGSNHGAESNGFGISHVSVRHK